MSPLARSRQCIVKAHCNVTDEQSSSIGDFEASGVALHQTVGFERRERGELAGKVFLEMDSEFLRHRGEIE